MSEEESTFNTTGLDELRKMISSNKCTAKLGILGDKDSRTSKEAGAESNATIGARLEFGSMKNGKVFSFLRMPVTGYLDKQIAKPGFFNQKDIDLAIQRKSLKNMIEKIAVAGLGVVLEAFNTGGFGTWPDLEPSTWAQKKVKQKLVETHQLRDSISFEIEENI